MDPAYTDFFGLPSFPLSIYHMGPPWPPSGLYSWRIPKNARPVLNHEIAPVWRKLGKQIYTYFDSIRLLWTSIDPVRFAEDEKEPGPLFLWVGVLPGTLSSSDAENAAVHCKEIMSEHEITDVEIAFRESTFTRSAGPQLLNRAPFDPTAGVRGPFTPALGLQITPKAFPYLEGTGCLYLCEGGGSDRVFLLTTRHTVLPPSEYPNDLYHRKDDGIPRHEVIHLGSRAFQNALKAIMSKIFCEDITIAFNKGELEGLGEAVEGEDAKKTTKRQAVGVKLARAEESKARMYKFHDNIAKFWNAESDRILGHVLYSPPISVGTGDKPFMEDWALIELNRGKFNWDVFKGNVINLGTS